MNAGSRDITDVLRENILTDTYVMSIPYQKDALAEIEHLRIRVLRLEGHKDALESRIIAAKKALGS